MFGLYFYWLSWLLWIVVTFFQRSGKYKTSLSVGLLMIIIFANVLIPLKNYQFSLSFLLLLLLSIALFLKVKKPLYHVIIAFMIMIGYSGILLWILYTPLWLFLHELILIPLLCNIVIMILTRGLLQKITVLLFGMCFGELFSQLIFMSYGMQKGMGSLQFFDQLFTSLVVLLLLHGIQRGLQQVSEGLNNYKHKRMIRRITFE